MIAYLYKRVINTQNIYDQRDTPALKKNQINIIEINEFV